MVTMRRAVGLGLFVVCLVVSSHTPTLAQGGGEKKHPVLHKAAADLRDAHKRLKALEPHFNGHRAKAMEHIEKAIHEIHEIHEGIEFVDGEAKK